MIQIRLRTSRVSIDAATRAEVEQRIEVGLRRFAPRLRLVELHFADENGDRGGIDKRCVVTVHLQRGAPVHVEARAAEGAVAADVALERAARVLARRIERLRDCIPRSASGLAS